MTFAHPQNIEDALADYVVLVDTYNLVVGVSNAAHKIAAEVF